MEITPRIEQFIREYRIDFNGTAAGMRMGMKRETAVSFASRTLKSPVVRQYLKEQMDKDIKKLDITPERVIRELGRIGFYDIGVYYKPGPNGKTVLKELHELSPDERAAIVEYGSGKLKLASKDPALDKLGKHFKLFTELHEQQHTFTIMGDVRLNGKALEFNVGSPPPKT